MNLEELKRETRVWPLVAERYRARGGKWGSFDIGAMCHALTSVEDELELTHPRWPERSVLRAWRRSLELGLD